MVERFKSNIPIRRTVGWIDSQIVQWEVLELKARFQHENFNLTNSKSVLLLEMKLFTKDPHQRINSVYIGQRYINENGQTIALIEMAPYFVYDSKNKKNEYSIFIKEPIENFNWGKNYYRVQIGKQQVDLVTNQKK